MVQNYKYTLLPLLLLLLLFSFFRWVWWVYYYYSFTLHLFLGPKWVLVLPALRGLKFSLFLVYGSVDAEKRPQQLNLFLLGNYRANPSSNANMTVILCTCQPENTVRIRRWGSGVDPLMLKSEIVNKELKMRGKNCEWVEIKEFSNRGTKNLVGNVKAFR